MKRRTFYTCEKCGKIVLELVEGASSLMCCGEAMQLVVPNADGAPEKHVPNCSLDGDTLLVKVGEVEHPMIDVHYISWVYLATDKGVMAQCLKPGDEPVVRFELTGQKPIAVYEYCTVHGLWECEL